MSEEKPAEAAGPAEAKQEAREAKTSIGSFDWASIKVPATAPTVSDSRHVLSCPHAKMVQHRP